MKREPSENEQRGVVRTLERIAIGTIFDVFSDAFASYFLPMNMTLEQFTHRMNSLGVDYGGSYGYFEDDTLVSFVLHGFKTVQGQTKAYNAGTGTRPANRGRGLTRHVYGACIDDLCKRGVNDVRLEVIVENHAAIRAYEAIGFITMRELLYAKHSEAASKHRPIAGVHVDSIEQPNWTQLRQFWDWPPTWQNDVEVLDAGPDDYVILGASRGDRLLGYLALAPRSGKVAQYAVDPAFRRQGIGTALVHAARERSEGSLVFVNVDAGDDASVGFLQAVDLQVQLRQYDMLLSLPPRRLAAT
ncbi:MAG: GNAT family N-acetyltransferase [Myxococcota bacterium]